MGVNSKIEWCDHTVNLWWGCAKVHTGCKNCYAENLSETRYKNGVWGEKAPRKMIKSAFPTLDKLQRKCKKEGVFETVFVQSMGDIFEDSKPMINHNIHETTGSLREAFFSSIKIGRWDNLIFLLLTKRPQNIFKYWGYDAPENVWFGTSASDQATADEYIELLKNFSPILSKRFLSMEPQIANITTIDLDHVDWVIQGGESGPGKRPFDINWAWYMKGWCDQYRVPYFFKQIDKIQEIPEGLQIRQFPKF